MDILLPLYHLILFSVWIFTKSILRINVEIFGDFDANFIIVSATIFEYL